MRLFTTAQVIEKLAEVKEQFPGMEDELTLQSIEQETSGLDEGDFIAAKRAKLEQTGVSVSNVDESPVARPVTGEKTPVSASTAAEGATAASSTSKKVKIEGVAPPDFSELPEGPPGIMAEFGFKDVPEGVKMLEYLKLNGCYNLISVGGGGHCMFNALRAQLFQWEEYTSMHMRRDLVMFILQNYQHFRKEVQAIVRGLYGWPKMPAEEYQEKLQAGTLTPEEKQDQAVPGPFSEYSYLLRMASSDLWGDAMMILAFSRRFMMKVSVLHSNDLRTEHWFHQGPWFQADVLLICCDEKHFVTASKLRIRVRSCVFVRHSCVFVYDFCVFVRSLRLGGVFFFYLQ